MKRFLCLFLALLFTVAMVSCSESNGEFPEGETTDAEKVIESRDFFQWDSLNKNQITGYTEEGLKQKELVIPSNCEKVNGLNDNTFVERIIFKNADTKLPPCAFHGCTSLEAVVLPKNLKEVPHDAFSKCAKLKSIEIPDSVTKIGSDAFWACASLETVKLSTGLVTLGIGAFERCSALKSIEIPHTVTVLAKSTFKDCTNLSNVIWGTGLVTIEASAFQSCNSLKNIELPEGLKKIEKDAFSFCEGLESISIPSSVDYAAASCVAQTHEITIYVAQGSYMDGRVEELMDNKYYNKQYK